MSKFLKCLIGLLKNDHFLDIVDINVLRDAILETVDKARKLKSDGTWNCERELDVLLKYSNEMILSMNRIGLTCMFDFTRDIYHTNGSFLERIYPSEACHFKKILRYLE